MLIKRNWLVIGIVTVLLIGIGVAVIFYVSKAQSNELLLSDYPELFQKDAMIIVGENASQMENEVAQAIAAKLEELTGNEPIKKKDSEVSENDKRDYNLVLVGTPNLNNLLQEMYDATNATRVTEEYPGEGKGILEILRNPWNSDKALLIVAGSDEWGAKAGGEILEQARENMSSVIVKWEDFEATTIEFDSLSNPHNLSNPTETAKLALNEKCGEDWYKEYQIGWHYKYPSIPFDHWLIRISPDFCILVTSEEVYFLSPEDFNDFLGLYGKNISLEQDRDVIYLFEVYLKLYGLSSSVQDEEIFTERHLELWTDEAKGKYNVNPEDFTNLDIKREDSYCLLDCYTITRVQSYPTVPSPQDIIISHYSVRIGSKGDICIGLINRTKYAQVIPAGPR
jgi:hypothetical protein